MATIRESNYFPSGPLRERVKELKCLQRIVALLETTELPPEKVLQGVVDLIPSGWQHPDLCRVRIKCHDRIFQTPDFTESPWMQRVALRSRGAPVGCLEVGYSEKPSGRREDPFLLEEKKLIGLIGNRLGKLIEEWDCGVTPSAKASRVEPEVKPKPEWIVILDLLKETDSILYKRILRRLMNHLNWQGVPGVQGLLLQISPESYAGWSEAGRDENQPLPKQNVEMMDRVFEEAIWIASLAIPEKEMSKLIRQWMRQDRLGFFLVATEKREVSLAEIKEIISRFCRSTREDEQALSLSDDLQARVALVRRFLSERLPFIRIAREHMTIHDFGRLLSRVTGLGQGTGKLGGKAAGMVVAEHILRKRKKDDPAIGEFLVPDTWFITSDAVIDFVHYNFLEDFQSFKFLPIEEIRHNYPYLEQVFKHSFFSPEMQSQLKLILEEAGEEPLIVRSSSLLEDSYGTAFSGKYRSLFLANIGPKEERLAALSEAVAEVYASLFNPDAIQYRAERGLLDYYEEMGVLIQRVVGKRIGRFFFPSFAGVAFCNNEFRWSPRIRREDGVLRMVAGLGTRAVDRVGNDYPVLVSPGQPTIRVNIMPEEMMHYAQKFIDIINLETGRFETHPIEDIIRESGTEFPLWEHILSVYDGSTLRKASRAMDHPDGNAMVVTFAGLIENTGFIKQMKEILRVLRQTFGLPMDVEFAHDGKRLYVLQCRPQSQLGEEERALIPKWVPEKRKLFSANKHVSNAQIRNIRTIVYVDPERYAEMSSHADMVAVGDAVSRLNAMLPKKSFILMGPGRWGSRGDIRLGVRVTYSDINNSAMLIEIARKSGNYVPDLSFGTHFFQDLVEANIRYLALYPDEEGVIFAEEFFKNSPNSLVDFLPEYEYLSEVIKVIDIPRSINGCELNIVMDAENEMALGFLSEPKP